MTIDDVRRTLQDAENAGDAGAIGALMADDVVAMVPTSPVLEGREACRAFVQAMLSELLAIFERRVEYASAEAVVLGDHAYDRGTFAITCVSRADGGRHEATGKYFWLLRRAGDGWLIARLIHAVDEPGEPPEVPETLETSRLRLARPRPGDAPDIFDRYASDPEVTRYLAWPTHRTLADTQAFVVFSDQQWSKHGVGPYLIRSRDGGRLLGGTGLQIEGQGRASTGYVLARDAWGQGYATETVRAVIALATDRGLSELSALCHAEHAPSRRVLEKCGFALDDTWTVPATFPNLPDTESRHTVRYALKL
ncbi:MAG TPA: GNAT family N-acetyltransferase [Vicinamibacterales bacterium]|nr:GNAT family N-acetyltransferase [Vicinamibacterales bacterium]